MNKVKNSFKYCNSISEYSRFVTREVHVGTVPLGGSNPIRIQSMTTTDTMDTVGTVEQSIRMIDAGSEYIRITAPSIKEAKNLSNIKRELKKRGYYTPLIADIHFTPNAALLAAEIVEKVRINPGNFADRKKFEKFEYTDEEYKIELERIHERFSPLVKVCKLNGTVLRIGTNHGSLSDRIMNRYGDTPLGMVESALEFIRICQDHNFYDIVLSMKSSNPIIMVNSYRLLVNRMMAEEMKYPLHLGVTEAGDGMEGRVKSSIGIGTLLDDGLGDTIRVSLTEEPEFELPVAKRILKRYNKIISNKVIENFNIPINPFQYKKRDTTKILNIGEGNVPRVIIDVSNEDIDSNSMSDLGYTYSKKMDKWIISDTACDYIYTGSRKPNFKIPLQLGLICDYTKWITFNDKTKCYPLMNTTEYLNVNIDEFKFVYINEINKSIDKLIEKSLEDNSVVFILEDLKDNLYINNRLMFFNFLNRNNKTPIIISKKYNDLSKESVKINSSIDLGGLLIDGFGDGIFIRTDTCSINDTNVLSFCILQSTRTRISKTEYISCPSCGRTQFDLQKTTNMVRSRTSHLKGLKIAVMGCIVNGPGEMADADYGYVGIGKSKISLYKGHNIIKSNISSDKSVDELIKLIKANGDWINP